MNLGFYNTGGYYFNSAGNGSAADSEYTAGPNRKWRMDISANQMSTIPARPSLVTVRMYNRDYWNANYSYIVFASKCASITEAFTEGNYFAVTSVGTFNFYPAWQEFNFDCTACFQYAYDNWQGESWYLWFSWASDGSGDCGLVGYNNSTYYAYRPYFNVTVNGIKDSISYVFVKDKRTQYSYPESGMTANVSQNCYVASSTNFSTGYPAWCAFDHNTTTNPWASATTDTAPTLAIQLPEALYDVSVQITNRGDTDQYGIEGPISGRIEGSHNGTTWEQIGTFSGRDGDTLGATSLHSATNTSTAYKYVRIVMTDWAPSGNHTYCAVGEMRVFGYSVPSIGQFVQAEPYVYLNDEWKPVSHAYVIHSST